MPDGTLRWGVPFVEHRLKWPIVEPWPHEAGRRTSFRCVFFRRQEQVVSMNEASAIARPQRTQGMLFGDPLPQLDADSGYRGPVACRAAGITYRQLDYWARTGLVEPSIRSAKGSGSQRLYSFRDILVLKVVKRLLDTGVSLQQIRTAVSALHSRGVEDLASITLMSDGASVYECTSADEVMTSSRAVRASSASPWGGCGTRSRERWRTSRSITLRPSVLLWLRTSWPSVALPSGSRPSEHCEAHIIRTPVR